MPHLAQQCLALAAVALSAAYLLRGLWRSLRGRPAGLACCSRGCAAAPPAAAPRQIISGDALVRRARAAAAHRRQVSP